MSLEILENRHVLNLELTSFQIDLLSAVSEVPKYTLESLWNELGPFSDLYRNPNGLLGFYRSTHNIVNDNGVPRWEYSNRGIIAHNDFGHCGSITHKFANFLTSGEGRLILEQFASLGMNLGIVRNVVAPFFPQGGHQILYFFRSAQSYGIAVDPSLGIIALAGLPGSKASFPYIVLDKIYAVTNSPVNEGEVQIDFSRVSPSTLVSTKFLALGLSANRSLPILYSLMMSYDELTGVEYPVIIARFAKEESFSMFRLVGRRDYREEGLRFIEHLSPYQRNQLINDPLGFCEAWYRPARPPRSFKPKPRR